MSFRRLENALTAEPVRAGQRWIRQALDTEIADKIVRVLFSRPFERCEWVDGFKARAAQKARDYIDTHATESPTIRNVTRSAGVSWRTLDYAFHQLYGVTPKQYLQATRLDGVRRELHRKGPSVTISDIANRWGFWHMGQFAADYRKQFGELPSETRRRISQ
jgi:AraC-like DNA-binding protein